MPVGNIRDRNGSGRFRRDEPQRNRQDGRAPPRSAIRFGGPESAHPTPSPNRLDRPGRRPRSADRSPRARRMPANLARGAGPGRSVAARPAPIPREASTITRPSAVRHMTERDRGITWRLCEFPAPCVVSRHPGHPIHPPPLPAAALNLNQPPSRRVPYEQAGNHFPALWRGLFRRGLPTSPLSRGRRQAAPFAHPIRRAKGALWPPPRPTRVPHSFVPAHPFSP